MRSATAGRYHKRLASQVSVLSTTLVSICCLIAACGAQPSAAPPALPRAAVEVLITAGGPPTRQADLSNAVELLIQRCMHAKGLIYYPGHTSPSDSASDAKTLAEFPEYQNLAERQANGYGLYRHAVQSSRARKKNGAGPIAKQQPNEEATYTASLSAPAQLRYAVALFGAIGEELTVQLPGGARSVVRSGGCRASAVTTIYGSVPRYIFAVEGASLLFDDLINVVQASPIFKAGLRNWSRCMEKRGFPYTSPSVAFNSLAHGYVAKGPSRSLRHREIAVAVADLECAQRVMLLQTTSALQLHEAGKLGSLATRQLLEIVQIDQQAFTQQRQPAVRDDGSERS